MKQDTRKIKVSLFRVRTGRTPYTLYFDDFGGRYVIMHCKDPNIYPVTGYYLNGKRFSSVQSAKRSILRSLNK